MRFLSIAPCRPRGDLLTRRATAVQHSPKVVWVLSLPSRRATPAWRWGDIIGAPAVTEIEAAGSLRFHAVGDTGLLSGNAQQDVADAMDLDFDVNKPATNPAFFFHLGDVIYGHSKDISYRDEFYRPYTKYPAKIIAVPGNHDGETFAGTDPKPLGAFLANFCAATAVVAPQASAAGVFRETMTQPGVYWMLDGPFVQIIGLYSNIAEGPGDLEGAGGDQQQIVWLNNILKTIAASRKPVDARPWSSESIIRRSARAVIVGARRCSNRSITPVKRLALVRTRCSRATLTPISATRAQ